MNTKSRIEKLDNQGRGITYFENKITFVENALEGERVSLVNLKRTKKYNEAEAENIEELNPNRVLPKCPYYKICGGCNLQHINYDYQSDYKLKKLKDIMMKYAGIDQFIRIVKNDKELFYRNKITLKIEDNKWGYYNKNTHTFCEIENCLLAKPPINEIINKKQFINVNNGSIVIRTNYKNEILLSITTDREYNIDYSKLPENVVGIVVNNETVYKDNFFYDEIGQLKFKISYDAFFQVNNFIASNIFILLQSNLKGKKLLDLYCGVGTLGQSLKDNFDDIYGIEINENAIINAKENAKINGIKNSHYYAGDTYKILKDINVDFDTVIVDPPRSGLNSNTIELLLNIKPEKIAYISCDPMTLARDLKILKEHYDIVKLNGLDMFPNTFHIECVCVLKLR